MCSLYTNKHILFSLYSLFLVVLLLACMLLLLLAHPPLCCTPLNCAYFLGGIRQGINYLCDFPNFSTALVCMSQSAGQLNNSTQQVLIKNVSYFFIFIKIDVSLNKTISVPKLN